jgi:hypothetical protein
MKSLRRTLTFTKEERARLAVHCSAMGVYFEDFVHEAAMQACDEMDGIQRRLSLLDRLSKVSHG